MFLEFFHFLERSEEHTSELQSHSEISYAVFCLKKKKDRKSTRLNSSHIQKSRMPSSARKKKKQHHLMRYLLWIVQQHHILTYLLWNLHSHLVMIYLLLYFQHSSHPIFFFNDTSTTEIYTNLNTLSLHDALPI